MDSFVPVGNYGRKADSPMPLFLFCWWGDGEGGCGLNDKASCCLGGRYQWRGWGGVGERHWLTSAHWSAGRQQTNWDSVCSSTSGAGNKGSPDPGQRVTEPRPEASNLYVCPAARHLRWKDLEMELYWHEADFFFILFFYIFLCFLTNYFPPVTTLLVHLFLIGAFKYRKLMLLWFNVMVLLWQYRKLGVWLKMISTDRPSRCEKYGCNTMHYTEVTWDVVRRPCLWIWKID